MKIAVIGAGAIGSLAAGYLKDKGQDVILTGHPDSVRVIQKNGLHITGALGDFKIDLDCREKLNTACDLVILATKTQDLEAALGDNLEFIKKAIVLTAQNGIQADKLAAKFIPKDKIISSIVMFGATCLKPGEVVHNFQGSWVLGKMFSGSDSAVLDMGRTLGLAFSVEVAEDIRAMKYLKIFVNSNNCIPAILGKSMQEAFSNPQISGIAMAIWKEGLALVAKAGIKLASLPDFPLERLTKMASMPTNEAGKIFSGIMVNLSKEPLYGSILQSIKRGKPSEIDYINGEFVSIARQNNLKAPLNEKMVEMVHQVEKTGKFFSKEELISQIKGLVN